MTDLRTAAQQALEFVTSEQWGTTPYMDVRVYEDAARLRDTLRAALAQQEQEPSVCARCGGLVYDPVWVAQSDPPRREWQSLTEEEINRVETSAGLTMDGGRKFFVRTLPAPSNRR